MSEAKTNRNAPGRSKAATAAPSHAVAADKPAPRHHQRPVLPPASAYFIEEQHDRNERHVVVTGTLTPSTSSSLSGVTTTLVVSHLVDEIVSASLP